MPETQWALQTLSVLAALEQHSNVRVISYTKDLSASPTHSPHLSHSLSVCPGHMPHMVDAASQAQATVCREEAVDPLRLHVPLFPDPGLGTHAPVPAFPQEKKTRGAM